jgi:hypothetical protein
MIAKSLVLLGRNGADLNRDIRAFADGEDVKKWNLGRICQGISNVGGQMAFTKQRNFTVFRDFFCHSLIENENYSPTIQRIAITPRF